jgi:hypothetical protein
MKWQTGGIERIQEKSGWLFGFVRICGRIIFRLKSEIVTIGINRVQFLMI